MTARQAADRGHGTILSDRMHSSFYSLHLVAGSNIIIITSASLDQPPTQIEAATMDIALCHQPCLGSVESANPTINTFSSQDKRAT